MKFLLSLFALITFLAASNKASAECLYISPDDITYNSLFEALRYEKKTEIIVPENFGKNFCTYPINNQEGLNHIQLKYYFTAQDYFSLHNQSEINRFILRVASSAALKFSINGKNITLPENTFLKANSLINKKLRYDSTLKDVNDLVQEIISKFSESAN